MTRYRIVRRYERFWIQHKPLWLGIWVNTERSGRAWYTSLEDALRRLDTIKTTVADNGAVVWESPE